MILKIEYKTEQDILREKEHLLKICLENNLSILLFNGECCIQIKGIYTVIHKLMMHHQFSTKRGIKYDTCCVVSYSQIYSFADRQIDKSLENGTWTRYFVTLGNNLIGKEYYIRLFANSQKSSDDYVASPEGIAKNAIWNGGLDEKLMHNKESLTEDEKEKFNNNYFYHIVKYDDAKHDKHFLSNGTDDTFDVLL